MTLDLLGAHVDAELAAAVKRAAEKQGVTASRFIGQILEREMTPAEQPAELFYKQNVAVYRADELVEGLFIVIDPLLGPEKINMIRTIKAVPLGDVVHMYVSREHPSFGTHNRGVVRGTSEPIVVLIEYEDVFIKHEKPRRSRRRSASV